MALGMMLMAVKQYIAGYAILGLFSGLTFMPLFPVASLFPGYENTIIAVVSGCVDSSAVVFVVFGALHRSGVALSTLCWMYVGIVVLPLFIAAIFLLPDKSWAERFHLPGVHPNPASHRDSGKASASMELQPTPTSANSNEGPASSENSSAASPSADELPKAADVAHEEALISSQEEGRAPAQVLDAVPADMPAGQLATPSPPTFLQQANSGAFLVYAVFVTLNLFKFQWFLSTIVSQARVFLDADEAVALSNGFGTILACGVLLVIFVGQGIDRLGIAWASRVLCLVSALELAMGLVESVPAYYVRFVLFTLFRAGTFSLAIAHAIWAFDFHNYGRLVGAVYTVAGAINLAIPDIDVAVSGHYFTVNLVLLIATVLQAGLASWFVQRRQVSATRKDAVLEVAAAASASAAENA